MNNQMNADSSFIAVIDTETTWSNHLMSVGLVIADARSFKPVAKQYYIISPACEEGGMFSAVLNVKSAPLNLKDTRQNVMRCLIRVLQQYHVRKIFAYNAAFDYNHLHELKQYAWFDIMRIAAYRQYNKKIPSGADCYKTGRLRRNYGVEPKLRLLSDNPAYREVHNALCDAVDELRIMELLGLSIEQYQIAEIGAPCTQ